MYTKTRPLKVIFITCKMLKSKVFIWLYAYVFVSVYCQRFVPFQNIQKIFPPVGIRYEKLKKIETKENRIFN